MIFDSTLEKNNDLTPLGISYLCSQDGFLDLLTVNRILKKFYSRNQMQVFADNYFGKRQWDVPTVSEVTKEEFLSMYEFGKFERVVDWILFVFETTGKLLTKKDLFSWIQE